MQDQNQFGQQTPEEIYPTYDYDINNIRYRPMTVEDWAQIPTSQSCYSQYWDNPSSFSPEQFAENIKAETSYYDFKYTILFLINLCITVALISILIFSFDITAIDKYMENSRPDSTTPSDKTVTETIKYSTLTTPMFLALFIAILINAFHFSYANMFPVFYIKLGMIIGIVVSSLSFLFSLFSGQFYPIFLTLLMLIGSGVWYYFARSRIPFSAAVFKTTTGILLRNPGIIAVSIFEIVLDLLINIGYLFVCLCVTVMNLSPFWYVYCVFSYVWITLTISYVIYMTGAGVAATFYFLDGTPQYPQSPTWNSFKRACTTSFGSASFAGFIVAVIQALKALINILSQERRNNNDRNNNRTAECCLELIKCMAICILNILESMVRWITRYALIYCAIYGVPFKEGCRRWAELEYNKFIKVLIDGCVVNDALAYNLLVFSLGTGVVSYLVAKLSYRSDEIQVFFIIVCMIFTWAGLLLMNNSMKTMNDTLFVCFAENPDTLKQNNPELFETLSRTYSNLLDSKVSNN